MRKSVYFSIFLIITSMINISGQETNPKLSNYWSASLSFAPITTFYYYHGAKNEFMDYYSKGVTELIYPTGTNLRIDYKLNNRLSISSGINFKVRKHDNLINIIGEWSGSYYEKSTDDKYIFEIPIQISYQILNSPKLIDPYLKTGLRNTYFKRFYTGEFTRWDLTGTTTGKIDNHDGKFILFYEFGAGTYFNLSKSISMMIESNLTYTISGFGYLELQGGLRYSFR
jgi:hypothetical protein